MELNGSNDADSASLQLSQQRQRILQQRQVKREKAQAQRQKYVMQVKQQRFFDAVNKAFHQALQRTANSLEEYNFERLFKQLLRKTAPHAKVFRNGSAKWTITIGPQEDDFDEGGHKVYMSLRLKGPPEILKRMREVGPAVRRTLLGNGAEWLKRLGRNGESIDPFLDAVNDKRRETVDDSDAPLTDVKRGACKVCGQSLWTQLLHGSHHCRMLATFKCPKCSASWTTQRGRWSVTESRILGQDCKNCREPGEVEHTTILTQEALDELQEKREELQEKREVAQRRRPSNQFLCHLSGPAPQPTLPQSCRHLAPWLPTCPEEEEEEVAIWGELSVFDPEHPQAVPPRIPTKEHYSDLCEGCRRYGDCSGIFMEPFVVLATAKLLEQDDCSSLVSETSEGQQLRWAAAGDGLELASNRGTVSLVPHLYEATARIDPMEARRITHDQRQAFMRDAGLSSISNSQVSSSSCSRTMRTSEDDDVRRHFGAR